MYLINKLSIYLDRCVMVPWVPEAERGLGKREEEEIIQKGLLRV